MSIYLMTVCVIPCLLSKLVPCVIIRIVGVRANIFNNKPYYRIQLCTKTCVVSNDEDTFCFRFVTRFNIKQQQHNQNIQDATAIYQKVRD